MKVRDVIKRLQQDGWKQVHMKGSHRQFKHAVKKVRSGPTALRRT